MNNILLLGPPGSGKGTLSLFIEQQFGYKHLSTGDLLRDEISKGTPLGKTIADTLKQGDLVEDITMVNLLTEKLAKNTMPLLLDGFPRTLGQAKLVEEKYPNFFSKVLYLNVPEADLITRITKRLICPKCNAVYNQITNPPQKHNICDQCHSTLMQRNDDTLEVFSNRLATYKKQTHPLLGYYADCAITINAQGDITKIQEEIKKVLS